MCVCGGDLALKLQFPPTWIHNYYFSLPRAFLIPATSVSGSAGCGVGFIFIWWLTCVWTAFCSSIGADSRKGRGDNDVRRIGTPSYYGLITVLTPCRCFQEPGSEGGSGWSNVLSVYIVNFTQLFTKHRGDSRAVYIIAAGKFWVIFFWILSRFSSIRMRGSLPHFCFCNVDLNLWGATGDSDYCKQTNSQYRRRLTSLACGGSPRKECCCPSSILWPTSPPTCRRKSSSKFIKVRRPFSPLLSWRTELQQWLAARLSRLCSSTRLLACFQGRQFI